MGVNSSSPRLARRAQAGEEKEKRFVKPLKGFTLPTVSERGVGDDFAGAVGAREGEWETKFVKPLKGFESIYLAQFC